MELEEHLEQAYSEPSVEIYLRRSTKNRQPSRTYSVNVYMLLSVGGEPESYQEVMLHDQKNRSHARRDEILA
jgi:hypothetical protein